MNTWLTSSIKSARLVYAKHWVSHAISEDCTGCGVCLKACPTNAIRGEKKKLYVIDQNACIQCGACYQLCKFDAIKRVKRGEGTAVQAQAHANWIPLAERKKASAAVS